MHRLALAALAATIGFAYPALASEVCDPQSGTLTEFKASTARHIAENPDKVGIIDTTELDAVKAFVAEAKARSTQPLDYLDSATEVVIFYNKLTGLGMVDYFRGECSLGFLIMPVHPPSQAS